MCVNTIFEFTHKICSELIRFRHSSCPASSTIRKLLILWMLTGLSTDRVAFTIYYYPFVYNFK